MIYDIVKVQSAPSFSAMGKMSYDLGTSPVTYTERGLSDPVEESGSSGPFCKVYIDSETNQWKLLGGTVSGGDKTETIADITIGNVGSEPNDGTFYWVAIAFKANVEDDVLLSGGDIQGVLIEDGTTVRDNQTPTVAQPSGRLYISLGEWMGAKFIPAGCGNIQVNHCVGSISYSRG
jgi:hypothetical protein